MHKTLLLNWPLSVISALTMITPYVLITLLLANWPLSVVLAWLSFGCECSSFVTVSACVLLLCSIAIVWRFVYCLSGVYVKLGTVWRGRGKCGNNIAYYCISSLPFNSCRSTGRRRYSATPPDLVPCSLLRSSSVSCFPAPYYCIAPLNLPVCFSWKFFLVFERILALLNARRH